MLAAQVCYISRDNRAIPPQKLSTKAFCDTIATSIARYEKLGVCPPSAAAQIWGPPPKTDFFSFFSRSFGALGSESLYCSLSGVSHIWPYSPVNKARTSRNRDFLANYLARTDSSE